MNTLKSVSKKITSKENVSAPRPKLRSSSFTNPSHPYFLPLVTAANTVLLFLLLLFYFPLVGSISSLKTASSTRLVETQDGRTLEAVAINNTDPSDEQIRKFTHRVMYSLHSWTGILPAEDELDETKLIQDEGIDIDGSKNKVPYLSWRTSLALDPEFRNEYLKKLAEIVPQGVFSSPPKAYAVPEVHEIGVPQKVNENQWVITWHAKLMIYEGQNIGKVVPLKYKIFVKQIDGVKTCPRLTEEECNARLSTLEKQTHKEQRENLIITKFKEIT